MSPKTILLILITLFILTLPIYFLTAIHRDEAIFLNISSGITQGYRPYLDYLDNKPPGIYYLFAPLIRLTGHTLLYPRTVTLIINLITAYFIYKISQLLTPKSTKITLLTAPLIYVITVTIYHGHYVLTETPMTLLLTAATYITILYLESPRKRRLLLIGLLLGLAALFKQVALINLAITLIIILTSSKSPHSKPLQISLLLLPFLTPIFIFAIYFLSQQSLSSAYLQIIDSILYHYPSSPILYNVQQLPNLLLPTWPLWIALLLTLIYEPNAHQPTTHRLLALSTIPVLLILYRPYHHYLIQVLPFVIILTTPYILKSRPFTIVLLAQLTFSILHFNYYIYTTDYAWRQNQLQSAARSTNCIGADDQLSYLRACPPPSLPE